MEECVICCEDIEVNTTFTSYCNHNFHHTCISRWCENNNSCPSCRAPNIMTLQQSIVTNKNNNPNNNNNTNTNNENTNNITNNIINDYINNTDNYIDNYINNINRNIINNNNNNREYYFNNILNYNDI